MSNRKKGFTLIEIVLAIALLLIAMGGIAAVIIGTKNSSEKLFTEGDLQQQLVEVQDSMQDEILATNVGLKYWVKSGDEWVYPNAETEQENVPKLFAIYNVDYIDYVLKKQYMYYDSSEKKLYYGDASESLDMSKTKAYTLNVDPDPQEVIDSLNDKWTVSSLKVKTFEIDSFVFGKKRLLPYRIAIEQDDVEYKASDTVNVRNEIKVNEPMVIDPAQTAKITKPVLEKTSFTYNGQEQGPQEKYFNSRYVRRVGSTLKAKDAGVYQVTYQLTQKNARWADGSTDEITYTWEILPIELEVTWGTTSWIYDGQAHSTEITFDHSVVLPGEDLVITLENNSVGPNVGSVTVNAVPSSSNYKIKDDENTHKIIEIKKAIASWDSDIQPKNYVYDGSSHILTTVSPTIGGKAMFRLVKYTNSEEQVSMSDEDWNEFPYSASQAGKYEIECKIAIDKKDEINYDAPATKIVTAVISKADPILTEPVINNNLVFNMTSQPLFETLPSAPPLLTIEYSVNGSSYTTNPPSAKNAGTYTIKYKTNSNNDYNESEEKTVQVKIKPADSKYVRKPKAKSLVYNGNPQDLLTKGLTSDGIVAYYIDSARYEDVVPQKTNAGTYKCLYQIIGDENHGNSMPEELIIKIEKADGLPPKTLPKAKDLTYNGSPQNLIVLGVPQEGRILYSLDQTNWTTTSPKGTAAGDYIVYYKVEGDSNHNDTPIANIRVTIKALPITVIVPPDQTITYDGNSHQAARVSVIPSDCTVKYGTTAGTCNLVDPPSKTNAGTLTVYYSVSKTGYTTKTGSYKLIVNKAQPTFRTKPTAKQGLLFMNKNQELIIPGTTSCGTIVYSFYSEVGFSTNIPKASTAGTYRIFYKVTGNSNYAETVYSLDATIGNSVLVGDVDLDGDITSIDATTVQQYLAEIITLNKKQLKAADVNNDGRVSGDDVTQIQRYCSGRHDAYNERIGSWIAY